MGASQNHKLKVLVGLLRIPLFYKILLANSIVFVLAWAVGSIITLWHVQTSPGASHLDLIIFFVVAGIVLGCFVNWLVLKLALNPLERLQSAVNEVQRGGLGTRIDAGKYSDERFDRLIATFNQMLAAMEQDSQRLHLQSGEILQAQEEERKRVARELHDETAQSLTSLLVRLRLLERSQDPEEARGQVRELRELTAHTLDEIHRIALELRPKILDDLGLGAALGWRIEEFNTTYSLRTNLKIIGFEGRLPGNLELVFYRVAQEALTNVARYAQAKQVNVILKRDEDRLELEVWDDGVGFNVAQIPAEHPRGLGLLGMRERLALVGGDLVVESKPGKGTRILARAPLTPPISDGAHD